MGHDILRYVVHLYVSPVPETASSHTAPLIVPRANDHA